MATAFAAAGLVSQTCAAEVQRELERREALASLRRRVSETLTRAQRTDAPEAWQQYATLRARLPRHLRVLH